MCGEAGAELMTVNRSIAEQEAFDRYVLAGVPADKARVYAQADYPHLEYYDPARQEIRFEHEDCVVEDGERWFGHGMPCRHPEWHEDEAS
jgi:hypothetical protein